MSKEITVRTSLSVRNGNLNYQSSPTTFQADQAVAVGPTPSFITVSRRYTTVSFSQITSVGGQIGWCIIQNIDPLSTVYWGVYNAHLNDFIPVGSLLPGESAVFRLCPLLGEDLESGTGTAPGDAYTNQLALKAIGAQASVRVDAFAN